MIPPKMNSLTFVRLTDKNNDGRQMAEFLCDCGKTHETQLRYYLKAKSKSCGCKKLIGILNHKPTFSITYSPARNISKAISQLKANAKTRNIAFRLSYDECAKLILQPCYLCKLQYNVPISLDRIDNSKPYTSDNVLPCCKACNIMKHNMSLSDFLNHTLRITVAHYKYGEFRGSPEMGNPDPSFDSNILEGATNRDRFLLSLDRESNISKSAVPLT